MKLSYTQLDHTFSTADTDRLRELTRDDGENFHELLDNSVAALGAALGIPAKSIWYLLQNGWSQSLQDSFAGPRAKAIKEGLSESETNDVVLSSIAKRVKAIREGLLSAAPGGGRDPIKSVGLRMLTDHLRSKGRKLPKDKKALAELLEKFISINKARIDAEIAARKKVDLIEADLDDEDLELE